MHTPAWTVRLMLGAALGCGAGARAEVVRHDVPADAPVARGAAEAFDAVGHLLIGGVPRGTGTLIRDRWVLTSAHVAADHRGGGSWSIELAGTTHDVVEVLVHRDWTAGTDDGHDIALMRLAAPVSDPPPIPRQSDVARRRSRDPRQAIFLYAPSWRPAALDESGDQKRRRAHP